MSAARVGSGLLLLLACLSQSPPARASSPAWHPVDQSELDRVRAAAPAAAELFDRAEQSLLAGDLKAAESALRDARVIEPNSFLLARRHCQVLTELGQQSEALEACRVALTKSTAMDSRAFVGALMASREPPKPRELVQAVREASSARRLHNQPFSEAAFCEVAYHIGDDAMLNLCVHELESTAPGNFETARWRAVRHESPAWALWLGWAALGLLGAITLFHALGRWLRRPAKVRGTSAVTAAVLCLATTYGPSARADEAAAAPDAQPHWQLSRFPIDHADPEHHIPSLEERNKDPLQFGYFLQDLNVEALKAEREGDWQSALKYWRADAAAVPDMAVGFSRACRAYQMLGQVEPAIEFCARAVGLEGSTAEDYLRYAELSTGRSRALSETEIQDLDAMVKHLREKDQPGPAAVIECRIGVKLEDRARLERCTQVLAKLSPDDPHTMTLEWSYAMLRKDYGEADRLLAAMGKTNMNPRALAQARAATARASAWWRRPFSDWRYGAAVIALLAFGIATSFWLRRRMKRLETAAAPGSAPMTPAA